MAIRSDELQALSPEVSAFLATRSPQALGMVAVGEFTGGEQEPPIILAEFRRQFMVCDPVRQEVLNQVTERQFEPEEILKLAACPDSKTDISLNGEEWTFSPDEIAVIDILTNNRGAWVTLKDVLPSLLVAPQKPFLEGRREVFARVVRGLNAPRMFPTPWIEKRGQSLDSQYRFAPFVAVSVELTEEQEQEVDVIMQQLGVLPKAEPSKETEQTSLVMREDFRENLQILDPELHAKRNQRVREAYDPEDIIEISIYAENRFTVNGVEKPGKADDVVALLGVVVNNPDTSFHPREVQHGPVFGGQERSLEAKSQAFNKAKNYIKALAGEGKNILPDTGDRTSRKYSLGPNVVIVDNTNTSLQARTEMRTARQTRRRRLPASILPKPEEVTPPPAATAPTDLPPVTSEPTNRDALGSALDLLGDLVAGKLRINRLSNEEILDTRQKLDEKRKVESTLPAADLKDGLVIGRDERPTRTNEEAKEAIVKFLRGDTDVMPGFWGAMNLRQLRILLSTIQGEAAELGLGGSNWSKRFIEIQLAHNRDLSEEARKRL